MNKNPSVYQEIPFFNGTFMEIDIAKPNNPTLRLCENVSDFQLYAYVELTLVIVKPKNI